MADDLLNQTLLQPINIQEAFPSNTFTGMLFWQKKN